MSMMPPPDSAAGCVRGFGAGLGCSAFCNGTLVAVDGTGKAGAAFCCAACCCTVDRELLLTASGDWVAGTGSGGGFAPLSVDLTDVFTDAAGASGATAAAEVWVAAPGTCALLSAAEPGATSCKAGAADADVAADGAASGAGVPLCQARICARTSLLASVTLTACAS